jgi:hypothetical protein
MMQKNAEHIQAETHHRLRRSFLSVIKVSFIVVSFASLDPRSCGRNRGRCLAKCDQSPTLEYSLMIILRHSINTIHHDVRSFVFPGSLRLGQEGEIHWQAL